MLINSIVCIATAIYFEARSEPLEGQVAVANTIMNRVESSYFPNTPCEVVKQGKYWGETIIKNKCHFSFWCDGKPETIEEDKAYTLALSIAVNADKLVDITYGATYYHREDVKPYWTKHLITKRKIGKHIFY